jgi:hypothetical protein
MRQMGANWHMIPPGVSGNSSRTRAQMRSSSKRPVPSVSTYTLTGPRVKASGTVKSVMRPSDGAYVLFEGVVRNHHEGKAVESIFYDAYRPMAEKEIAPLPASLADLETPPTGLRL